MRSRTSGALRGSRKFKSPTKRYTRSSWSLYGRRGNWPISSAATRPPFETGHARGTFPVRASKAPSGFTFSLSGGIPMRFEVPNTGSRAFDRTGKSEADAHRTSPQYSLRSFSSFRFESAEIRKKDLNPHREKTWHSTPFLKGLRVRFENTSHNNNGAKNAYEFAARC